MPNNPTSNIQHPTSDNTVITVKNLTKIYHLYDKPQDRVKEALHPLRKSYHQDYYALENISLEVHRGETVGIVGRNGAGKSTLLKIITGVLTPSSGDVTVKGKIASLLELGAGFNPEMTGLENIYLNGTLMGFSREEMSTKIESITAFANIGDFIHQPVKMYSSGMFARLAFSVSINVEPDILIVDEALSVGDMAFQMKCFKKFQEFQEEGRTILFVTHGLDTVIRYCTRGIVIDGGKKIVDSTPKFAVDAFKKVLSGDFYEKRITQENIIEERTEKDNDTLLKDAFESHAELDTYGNAKATFVDYGILDHNNKPSAILDYNMPFQIVMKVRFNVPVNDPIFAFTLKDSKGLEITGTNTMMKHIETGTFKAGEYATVTFSQPANLQLGKYALSMGCVALNETGVEVFERIYDAILFEIIGDAQMVGFFDLQSEVDFQRNHPQ
jgi:teichoic acid transport system ATP-binding protein